MLRKLRRVFAVDKTQPVIVKHEGNKNEEPLDKPIELKDNCGTVRKEENETRFANKVIKDNCETHVGPNTNSHDSVPKDFSETKQLLKGIVKPETSSVSANKSDNMDENTQSNVETDSQVVESSDGQAERIEHDSEKPADTKQINEEITGSLDRRSSDLGTCPVVEQPLIVQKVQVLNAKPLTSAIDEYGEQIYDPDEHKISFRHKTDDVDHKEIVIECSDIADDSSVSSEGDEDTYFVESKKGQLKLSGTSVFCRIQSRTSRHGRKRFIRHYVVKEDEENDIRGKTGLKPLDELLKVNGKSLKNLTQRQVKRIFGKIRLDKETNKIELELHLRRWTKGTGPMKERTWTEVQELTVKITLVPDGKPCRAQKFRPLRRRVSFKVEERKTTVNNKDNLTAGYISIQELKGVKTRRFKYEQLGRYISNVALENGNVELSVITDTKTCCFNAEYFWGYDEGPKTAFNNGFLNCVRFRVDQPKGFFFLSSCIGENTDDLKFVERGDDYHTLKGEKGEKHVDERCFVYCSIGSYRIYQSLMYRDRFVACNEETKQLYMKKIPMNEQFAYVNGINDKNKRDDHYFKAVESFRTCHFTYQTVRERRFHERLGDVLSFHICGLGNTAVN